MLFRSNRKKFFLAVSTKVFVFLAGDSARLQRDVADQRSVTERSTRSGNSGKLPENAVNEVGWRQLLEEQPIFPRGQSSAAQESIRIRVHGGSSSSFYAAVIRMECNITQFLFPLDVKKIDYLSHDRVTNFGNLNYLPITMIFGLIFLFLVKNIN